MAHPFPARPTNDHQVEEYVVLQRQARTHGENVIFDGPALVGYHHQEVDIRFGRIVLAGLGAKQDDALYLQRWIVRQARRANVDRCVREVTGTAAWWGAY